MNLGRIAIFGATGYIGMLLSNELIQSETEIRLFVRNKKRLLYIRKSDNIKAYDYELKEENIELITSALEGVNVLYYLIHSTTSSDENFADKDYELAMIVSKASKLAKVGQIIFLGALGARSDSLSVHLSSRHSTADMLRHDGQNVTELRTAIIIGAGSLSFEIIRVLAKKLPFLPKLKITSGLTQPIDVDDVLTFLIRAANNSRYYNAIVELGGEQISYNNLITLYSRTIFKIDMPIVEIGFLEKILTAKIISHIVVFLSSAPYSIIKPLIDGASADALSYDWHYRKIDPNAPRLNDIPHMMRKAYAKEKRGEVESFWGIPSENQVLSSASEEAILKDSDIKKEIYRQKIDVDNFENIFNEILNIGGKHGYWSPSWMWKIRGFVDKLQGGPGLHGGRRTYRKEIRVGERIDFWIVSKVVNTDIMKQLRLKARMYSPGDSWLEFTLLNDNDEKSFTITAYFKPRGTHGKLYWYSLYFIHKYIFRAMLLKIISNSKEKFCSIN